MAANKPHDLESFFGVFQNEEALTSLYGMGAQTVKSVMTFMAAAQTQENFMTAYKLGLRCFFPDMADNSNS